MKACCMGWQLVHLDIKSPNVLLQDRVWLVAKIADLGISKYLAEGSLLEFTFRGASVPFFAVSHGGHLVWLSPPACLAPLSQCWTNRHRLAVSCVPSVNSTILGDFPKLVGPHGVCVQNRSGPRAKSVNKTAAEQPGTLRQ